MDNQTKDEQILILTQKNNKQMKWIFILGGILCLGLITVIAIIIIKVKTGGISKALKLLNQ